MRRLLSFFVLAASAAVAVSADAQSKKFTLAPTSNVRVDGTSNIHAWHATSAELTTGIHVAMPIGPGSKVDSVSLSVPVRSLKSGKGGLDKNLYKALRADEYPTIQFVMTSYQSSPKDSAFAAVVTGMLTVNGVQKTITAQTTMTADGKGGLRAAGSATFNMTEFGVKPPSALMGTIRTGDAVTVTFDLAGAPALALAALPRE